MSSQKPEKTTTARPSSSQRREAHTNRKGKILFHPWRCGGNECFFRARTGFLGANYRALWGHVECMELRASVCSDYSNKSGRRLSLARSCPRSWIEGFFSRLAQICSCAPNSSNGLVVAVSVHTVRAKYVFKSAHICFWLCGRSICGGGGGGGGVPKTQAGNFTALPVFVGVLFWAVDHVWLILESFLRN